MSVWSSTPRPDRSPSSTRQVPPVRYALAPTDGRLRGRTAAPDPLPAPPWGPLLAPAQGARRDRGAVRSRRTDPPGSGRRSVDRRRLPAGLLLAGPTGRVSATGFDIGAWPLERAALEAQAKDAGRISRWAVNRRSARRPSPTDSASWPSRSSCRPAEASGHRCWAGPTRVARLLALLCVFLVGALALGASAYWQVVDHERLTARGGRPATVTIDPPSQRGDDLRPDRHRRPGDHRPARAAGRGARISDPGPAPGNRRRADPAPRSHDAAAIALRDKLASNSRYLIIQHGIERQLGDRIRRRSTATRSSGSPRAGAGARLPAARRGPGNDARGAPARVRQPRRGRPVRRGAAIPGDPRGLTPVVVAQRDPTRRPSSRVPTSPVPASRGTDLRLTIDAGLQLSVEQELLAAWIADKAKRVSAVVMDPYTGEVYAMASYPSFDANDFKAIAATDPSRFVNPLVVERLRTRFRVQDDDRAAALQAGTVTPSTMIKDTGTLRLDGAGPRSMTPTARAMGWMTFQDGVAYSRNVVAAKVALGLGKTTTASARRSTHVDPPRLRQADRHRRRRRGLRHRAQPGDHPVARDRPGQRGVRSGRSGHPDPAATAYAADGTAASGASTRRQGGSPRRRPGRQWTADCSAPRCRRPSIKMMGT